jgi:hypothetical protein
VFRSAVAKHDACQPEQLARSGHPAAFDGVLHTVTPSVSGTFRLGDTFLGSYTFDPTTIGTNPLPELGEYSGAITSLTFGIGNDTGDADCSDGLCKITVQNRGGFCAFPDCYIVQVDVVGPPLAGVPPSSLFLTIG